MPAIIITIYNTILTILNYIMLYIIYYTYYYMIYGIIIIYYITKSQSIILYITRLDCNDDVDHEMCHNQTKDSCLLQTRCSWNAKSRLPTLTLLRVMPTMLNLMMWKRSGLLPMSHVMANRPASQMHQHGSHRWQNQQSQRHQTQLAIR